MDGKRTVKANGLELIQLDSHILPLFMDNPERNEIQPDQLIPIISTNFNSAAYVLAYLYSAVIVGKFENNEFIFYEPKKFDETHILKLRVFHQEQELLVWKSGNTLKARLRKDDFKGATCEAVVADHVLSGTKTESLGNGWIRISKKRGGVLDLPLQNGYADGEKARIFIRTYNYLTDISENKAWQSTYCDCRFAGFTQGPDSNFLA